MSITRVAAVDCGTTTLRLLVADLDPGTGTATTVERRSVIVRLGQDVDRTGAFAPAALDRVFAVLDDYAETIARHRAARTRMVATSAARDVSNRAAFVEGVTARLGTVPEVISGDEEGRLTFAGATRQLAGRTDLPAPYTVVDIGGGSTELVVGAGPGAEPSVFSLDVGSVRLTERHLHSDPPTPAQIAGAVADVRAALASSELASSELASSDLARSGSAGSAPSPADVGTVIGVAGTVVTIGALLLGLTSYDRERVNLARLAVSDVLDQAERLLAMSVAERSALAVMPPDRADVIGAGGLILRAVLEHLLEVRRAGFGGPVFAVSARDLLDGIAWSLVSGGD